MWAFFKNPDEGKNVIGVPFLIKVFAACKVCGNLNNEKKTTINLAGGAKPPQTPPRQAGGAKPPQTPPRQAGGALPPQTPLLKLKIFGRNFFGRKIFGRKFFGRKFFGPKF